METESLKRCTACDEVIERGQTYCRHCEQDRKRLLLQAVELKRPSMSRLCQSTSTSTKGSAHNRGNGETATEGSTHTGGNAEIATGGSTHTGGNAETATEGSTHTGGNVETTTEGITHTGGNAETVAADKVGETGGVTAYTVYIPESEVETQTDKTDALRFETADANPNHENDIDFKGLNNPSDASERMERRTLARIERERVYKEFKNFPNVDLSKYRNFGADCRHCEKEIRSGTKNTIPFWKHLKKAHPEVYAHIGGEKRAEAEQTTTHTNNRAGNSTTKGPTNRCARISRKGGKALVTSTSKTTRTSTRKSSTGARVTTIWDTRTSTSRRETRNRAGVNTYSTAATRRSMRKSRGGVTTTRATTKTSRRETSNRSPRRNGATTNKTRRIEIPRNITGIVGAETRIEEEMHHDDKQEEDVLADHTSDDSKTEILTPSSVNGDAVHCAGHQITETLPANETELPSDNTPVYLVPVNVDDENNNEVTDIPANEPEITKEDDIPVFPMDDDDENDNRITEIPSNELETQNDTPAFPVDDDKENVVQMLNCFSNGHSSDSEIVSEVQRDFYHALVDYFVKTGRPASEVELPVFKRLIEAANPWIDLPSETDLRSYMQDTSEIKKEKS